MKIKNVQLLYTGNLIASIILFFIGLVYMRSLQVVIANIEIRGFDPMAYDEPTYNFVKLAVFFCALTIFVGSKTREKLSLIGAFLGTNGFVFLCFAIMMFWEPRYLNLYNVFGYWCFYILANIVLTVVAIVNYEKGGSRAAIYEDNILDDLGE